MIERRGFIRIAGGLAAAAFAGACGGGDSDTTTDDTDDVNTEPPDSRALTAAELDRMASLLFDNYDIGGATFTYAGKLTGDDQLSLSGEIDWKNHVGHAFVSSKAAEAKVVEVFWSDSTVLERRPSLISLADGLGRGGFEWVARPPAPQSRELDAALAIVTGLASQQRDNPQIMGQKVGSAFLRSDTLRDQPVEVLRFGERVIFWVHATDATMMRLESNSENGLRPRVVDIMSRGAQTITPPDAQTVVTVETIGELWEIDTSS